MKNRRKSLLLVIVAILICFSAVLTIVAYAEDNSAEDAMVAIEENLADYKIGETSRLENDGYIGIPMEISVYFDSDNYTAVPDFMANGGTPVIIYVVNTMAQRVGTASDISIIKSMLERGYIVTIFDYLNNKNAESPALDWSAQLLRSSICSGDYFDNSYIPEGEYPESFVAPAGCNVSLSNVFWEADKHGADGTLEKIVETWNNDFRSYLDTTVIKWVDGDGERKSTANGINDGSAPVWYTDPDGKTVDTDGTGQYIKVMHTWANDIYDCVNPDGTPIDLNLYINIVYPDTPTAAVPVVSLANSSTFPTSGITSADQRPHTNGFLFSGYASVVFDYFWEPMARESSYGYFDGQKNNGGYTGDQMNYSLHIYNDKRIYTAAMRYLRYINNENSAVYNFDEDAFGVYGNSKGGWFTFLGNAELHDYTVILDGKSLEESIDARINAYTSKRDFPNHAGETYYQSGKTSDSTKFGITIDGGELQPWLTYASGEREGDEILAYANVLYACCGPAYEDMDIGGAPIFITSNLYDNYSSASGSSNIRTNLAKALDTPSLAFESPVGHMLTHSKDVNYGVDTYNAFFDFFGYYLNGGNTKVVYVTPLNGDAGVNADGSIVIKFIGSVDEDEIEKITIATENGTEARGTWSSLYGNTEWTFTPSAPLLGNTTYTVTVPASVTGDNGTTLGEDYVSVFTTDFANATEAEVDGLYISAKVPEISGNNGYSVMFYVANKAANVASLYAVESKNSAEGEYIGSVNLLGSGLYSIDATDYIMEKNAGDEVIFLVKADKAAGVTETFRDEFAALATSGYTADKKSRFANYVRSADSRYAAGEKYEAVTFDGASTVKFIMGMNGSRYPNIPEYEYDNEFYSRVTSALFSDSIINNGAIITEADYGRRFTVTVRLYDTTSRDMILYIESASGYYIDNVYDSMDYNQSIRNVNTKAGEWVEFTLDYVIHETDFGVAGIYEPKRLMLDISPEGYMENGARIDYPMYIDYISVTETVTDIEIEGAAIVATHDGGKDYKAPESSDNPFAVYSGDSLIGEFAKWSDALAACKDGYTVKLQSNFMLTDEDNSGDLAAYNTVNINLNGYKLTANTSDNGPIWLKANTANSNKTVVNVYDGTVYISDAPIVSYGESTSVGSGRAFAVNFSNVFFGISGRTMATSLAGATEASDGIALSSDISFNDCIFAIGNENIPYLDTVLFGASDTLDLSYTVTGGEIRLDSQRWLRIVENLKAASFTKGSDGKYTSLVLPLPYEPDSSAGYVTDDGISNYELLSCDGYFNEYSLVAGELSTKYGVIPEEYASADEYPTVIFDKDGNFVKAYNNFHGPLNYFATYSEGDDWYIVLRRDYEYTNKYDNLSKGNGTVTVDLCGHTVTCNGVMLYNADAKTNGDITVKTVNGKVLLSSLGAVRILGWDTDDYDTSSPKEFNFSFENIEFALAEGATTGSLVTYNYERASSAAPAVNNMTFTDCTFDISGAAAKTTLFTVGNYNGGQALSGIYTVNGGKIVADNSEYLDVYELISNTQSSIRFNKNDAGEYVKVVIPTSDSIPTDAFVSSSEGAMVLESVGVDGDFTVYSLKMNNLTTKWGDIAAEYASAEDYPWVVFDKNGNCVAGGKLFTTEIAAAACAAGDGSVILLRRDFNMDTDKQSSGSQNISKLDGSLTVDLGGHTVTMGNGGSADGFIRAEAYACGYNSYITVTNGKFIVGKDPIVRFSAISTRWPSVTLDDGTEVEYHLNTDYSKVHNFYITLDGLDFELDSSSSLRGNYALLYTQASSGYSLAIHNNNLIVKNCNIDVSASTNSSSRIVASHSSIGANVTIIGGNVIFGETRPGIQGMNTSSGSTIAFGKEDGSNYTSFVFPKNHTKPTTVYYNTDADALNFVKVSEDASTVTYRFRLAALADISFIPKMSITLDSNLIVNVYIPTNRVQKFTFDGVNYADLSLISYKKVTLDGEEYYLMKTPLAASEAARDLKLTASIDVDGKIANGSFTFSIIGYAEKINANGSEEEIQLVNDILSYIRAAYGYFGTEASAEIAKINTILGDNYDANNKPLFSGSTDAVTDGLSAATFVLDATPSVRFYIPEGEDVDKYEFFVDGKALSGVCGSDSDGNYIEFSVYAYAMGKTFTYKIDDIESGSYSLACYYENAKTLGDEELVTLVERFAKYCESAEAYRLSVIGE